MTDVGAGAALAAARWRQPALTGLRGVTGSSTRSLLRGALHDDEVPVTAVRERLACRLGGRLAGPVDASIVVRRRVDCQNRHVGVGDAVVQRRRPKPVAGVVTSRVSSSRRRRSSPPNDRARSPSRAAAMAGATAGSGSCTRPATWARRRGPLLRLGGLAVMGLAATETSIGVRALGRHSLIAATLRTLAAIRSPDGASVPRCPSALGQPLAAPLTDRGGSCRSSAVRRLRLVFASGGRSAVSLVAQWRSTGVGSLASTIGAGRRHRDRPLARSRVGRPAVGRPVASLVLLCRRQYTTDRPIRFLFQADLGSLASWLVHCRATGAGSWMETESGSGFAAYSGSISMFCPPLLISPTVVNLSHHGLEGVNRGARVRRRAVALGCSASDWWQLPLASGFRWPPSGRDYKVML